MANIPRFSGRSVGALVVIATAGITAAWAVGEIRDRRGMMGEDQQEVARISANMKPVCVGRFVIDLPARASKVAQLVTRLVPHPENRIPSGTGFCLDYACFKGLLSPDQGERIMLRARLTSHPDVEFRLMLAAGTAPDAKGLLDRTAESQRRMTFTDSASLVTLRAGRRVIGGRIGEEVVERIVEDDMLVLHSFWWEAAGTADDVLYPYLSFTMNTGVSGQRPVPASLSDSRAVLRWDRISSSIRAFASESSPATQRTEA